MRITCFEENQPLDVSILAVYFFNKINEIPRVALCLSKDIKISNVTIDKMFTGEYKYTVMDKNFYWKIFTYDVKNIKISNDELCYIDPLKEICVFNHFMKHTEEKPLVLNNIIKFEQKNHSGFYRKYRFLNKKYYREQKKIAQNVRLLVKNDKFIINQIISKLKEQEIKIETHDLGTIITINFEIYETTQYILEQIIENTHPYAFGSMEFLGDYTEEDIKKKINFDRFFIENKVSIPFCNLKINDLVKVNNIEGRIHQLDHKINFDSKITTLVFNSDEKNQVMKLKKIKDHITEEIHENKQVFNLPFDNELQCFVLGNKKKFKIQKTHMQKIVTITNYYKCE